jgi:putative FmdB family regulatory protein
VVGKSPQFPAVPTYEFQCDKCGRRFTVIRPIGAARAPACPKCRSKDTHQMPTAFYAKTIKKS